MVEYIERKAAEKCAEDIINNPIEDGFRDSIEILSAIHHLTAADVRPMVYGRWIMTEDAQGYAVCSHCHNFYMNPEFMTNGKWNFCPNCGADMRPRKAEEQPPDLTEK